MRYRALAREYDLAASALESGKSHGEKAGRLAELLNFRRLVNKTWKSHGGVGGGMDHLLQVVNARIKRLKREGN